MRQAPLRAFDGEQGHLRAEDRRAAKNRWCTSPLSAWVQLNRMLASRGDMNRQDQGKLASPGSQPRSIVLLCSLLLTAAVCHGQHRPEPTIHEPRTPAAGRDSAAVMTWDPLGSDDTVFTVTKDTRNAAGQRIIHAPHPERQTAQPVQTGQTILFVVEPADSSFLPGLFRWKPAK